jgi:peptide/nickel transport system ATP-binding protein
VMCAGRIVEIAPRHSLMQTPIHPYTKSLLAAVPFPDLDRPLDLAAHKTNGARDTRNWGAQFRDEGEQDALSFADLGEGHLVLARRSADVKELQH